VASAIANHWDPVTAATLAERTSLPPSTISAQLDRMEKVGVAERTELFGDSRTGYQLAERFFNIWFLMRNSSRRQRREVEFLTRFLESFNEPPDRSRHAYQLKEDSPDEAARMRSGIEGTDSPVPSLALTSDPLQAALHAAQESNWGLACQGLSAALKVWSARGVGADPADWLHAGAVLLHLNLGGELLKFLQLEGAIPRLRPWVEALRAHLSGDRRALLNICPEIRGMAGICYDRMAEVLKQLPKATCRRPSPEPGSKSRTRRQNAPRVLPARGLGSDGRA